MKRLRTAAPLVLGLASMCLFSGSAHAVTFETLHSETEKITTLPGTNAKSVIYSVNIANLAVGDILVVVGETEMTNDTGSPAKIAAQLILGSSDTATTGTALGENNNFNITPDMHHGVRVKGAIYEVTSTSHKYVNFVAWANGDLTVEDLGQLQVLVIHP